MEAIYMGSRVRGKRGTVSDDGNITASTRRLQNIAQGAASTTGDIVKRTARKSASRIGNIATATGTSRNGEQGTPRSNGDIRSESDRKSRLFTKDVPLLSPADWAGPQLYLTTMTLLIC
jgi:hypothetical protein